MKRPLVLICSAFIAGILTGPRLFAGPAPAFIFLFLFILLGLKFQKLRFVFYCCIVVCSFLLGTAAMLKQAVLPAGHIAYLTPQRGVKAGLSGMIVSEPRFKSGKYSFVLEVSRIFVRKESFPVSGLVQVNCYRKDLNFSFGQKVKMSGTLYRPYSFRAGKFRYAEYLRRKNIYSMFSCGKKDEVESVSTDKKSGLRQSAFSVRNFLNGLIRENFGPRSADVLSAMILGMRSDVPGPLENVLKNTGTVHVLAVSGLHVGIIIFIFLIVLKSAGFSYRSRLVLCLALLVFYCFLAGLRLSVIRAAIMSGVFIVGALLYRDYDCRSSLAFAALLILMFNPRQIFDAGFQLSFFSVFFILNFTQMIYEKLPFGSGAGVLTEFLKQSFSVSLAAWLGTAGIIAYHFGIISPIAVLANLFAVPLLFFVVGCGFLFLAAKIMFLGFIAVYFAGAAELFIALLYRINAALLKIPGACLGGVNPGLGGVVIYYLLVVGLFFAARLRSERAKVTASLSLQSA